VANTRDIFVPRSGEGEKFLRAKLLAQVKRGSVKEGSRRFSTQGGLPQKKKPGHMKSYAQKEKKKYCIIPLPKEKKKRGRLMEHNKDKGGRTQTETAHQRKKKWTSVHFFSD